MSYKRNVHTRKIVSADDGKTLSKKLGTLVKHAADNNIPITIKTDRTGKTDLVVTVSFGQPAQEIIDEIEDKDQPSWQDQGDEGEEEI